MYTMSNVTGEAGTMVDEIYREPAVLKFTGWSHSTLWARVKDGAFPKPVKIGSRAVGWFSSDILEHQKQLKAQRA
jgi:prophage regulatory protein